MSAYILGVFTLPAIFAAGWLIAAAIATGMEITCACGYSTGPMRTTRRVVMWTRWRWHRATRHHLLAADPS